MFLIKLFFYPLLFLSLSSSAFGEMLIIQSADQHSSYKQLPHFLASIEVVSRQFKQRFFNGQIVLIINGDFSSHPNSWSASNKKTFLDSLNYNPLAASDKGTFAYKILSSLAKKYNVIYTFGNHDAFDWADPQLFLQQMLMLKKSKAHLVVNNAEFYSKYKDLFKPYVDIKTSQNTIIRFIGYTLPGAKKRRVAWSQRQSPAVIHDILPIQNNLLNTLHSSNHNPRISSLIVSFHLGIHKTIGIFKKIEKQNLQKVKAVFSAHDHMVSLNKKVHKIPVIDSGSFFNFSTIILDNKEQILEHNFYDHLSQIKLLASVKKNSLEYNLIQRSNNFIKKLTKSKSLLTPKKDNHRGPCAKVFSQGF